MKFWFALHGYSGLRTASIFVCAVCMFGGLAVGAAHDFDGSSYARNASLDANLDIFWTVDTEAGTIELAVHAKSASGWVGVGMSEMGGMEGADIVYFETSTGNVTDAHSLVAGTPVIDECTQDWTLLSADVGDGSLSFEAERALDTGDVQDRIFADDTQDGVLPTRLIAAWGNTESVSYHDNNFAKGEVVMFAEAGSSDASLPLVEIKESADVKYIDVTTNNFTIPMERTWYQDTCLPASGLPSVEEYHAIGFEGLVESENTEYVHHFVLTGWYGRDDCGLACEEWLEDMFSSDSSYSSYFETASGIDGGRGDGESYTGSGSTSSPSSYSSFSAYLENLNITIPPYCEDYNYADVFAWAPGAADVELPTDVGFLMGNVSGGFKSLSLQTHYNNPDGDEGVLDSSGVRVYYTEELRPINMGVMKLGDPGVALQGMPLPDGKLSASFGCPSSCTEENFEIDEVTVFNHFLHMHENGRVLRTRQYRNDSSGNEVLVHTAEVEYYSYLQAGGFILAVNDSVTIQRGDRFETECYYDTALSSVGSSNVTFGLGSEQEMCIDFVYYYPDQMMPDSGGCGLLMCGGNILDLSEVADDSDFNRTFGMVDSCNASATEEPTTSSYGAQTITDGFDIAMKRAESGSDTSSSRRRSSNGLELLVIATAGVLGLVGIV